MVGSSKITLRPLQLIDSTSIAFHANNRLVSDNLRDVFPYPYTETDAIQFVQMASAKLPTTEFAISVSDEVIGVAGIILKEDIYRNNGEIGYWIGQRYWGEGVGTWVVGELVRIAFEDFTLYRVYAEVFENNIASARVLEKNGLIKEATLKNAIIKNGVRQNLNIYSIINPKQFL